MLKRLTLTVLILITIPAIIWAQPPGTFTFSYSANASANLILGQQKQIDVFYSWVAGNNNLQSPGLRSIRFFLRRDSSTAGSVNLLNPTIGNDIKGNPILFTGAGSSVATSGGSTIPTWTNLGGVAESIASSVTTPGSTPILLGSFNVNGQTQGSVTLRLAFGFYTDTNTSGGLDWGDLPNLNQANDALGADLTRNTTPLFIDASFNVTAVPEPTTWALIILSFASGVAGIVWYRRRQLQLANDQLQLAEEGLVEVE